MKKIFSSMLIGVMLVFGVATANAEDFMTCSKNALTEKYQLEMPVMNVLAGVYQDCGALAEEELRTLGVEEERIQDGVHFMCAAVIADWALRELDRAVEAIMALMNGVSPE